MKNKSRFLIVAFCILAMVFSVCCGVSAKQKVLINGRLTKFYSQTLSNDSSSVQYYGRSALSQLSRGNVLVFAYDALVKGVGESQSAITVINDANNLSVDELKLVFEAYIRDHPEHFWLGNEYNYIHVSGNVKEVRPVYLLSGESLVQAKEKFNASVNNILSGITSSMTDFDKEVYLHDALAQKASYVTGAQNAHNAYGALVDGQTVCEGYAEALQYLLQMAGIQSFLATGASINPSTGVGEPHAWNYVKLGDKFYHLDLTWNDQQSFTYHAYFNLSDDEIKKDHSIETVGFALPECNDNDQNYFKIKGGEYTTYTVNQIATLLEQNNLTASVYVPGGATVFTNWFKNNINQIISQIGITGTVSYGFNVLGNEVLININACLHNSLTFVAQQNANCLQDGNKAYYICSCGKWFRDSNAKQLIANQNLTKILATGHSYTQKLKDNAHLKTIAQDCQHCDTYWYDCADCNANAKDDLNATDKWYQDNKKGDHILGSDWAYKDANGHAKKCTVSGCNHTEQTQPHVPGAEATETTPQTCTDCGYIIVPALNHTSHTPKTEWKNDKNYHWHECTGCEGQTLEKAQHNDENNDSKCDVCGAEISDGSLTEKIITGVLVAVGIFLILKLLKMLFKRK